MTARVFEIHSQLENTLNLSIQLVMNNDFNYKKDVVMMGNFLNDSELQTLEYFLCKKTPFIYNNLWECKPDKRVYNMILKYKCEGIVLNGFKSFRQDSDPLISYHVPMFFWYNEFCTRPVKKRHKRNEHPKKFLMPLNRPKIFRELLLQKLANELPNSIYSCVFNNIHLPNDLEPLDDRYYQQSWYQDTCFSLVAETEPGYDDIIFITEKTFKPISAGHPFIAHGNPRMLELLKENGFKTFDKLFDESYDTILDPFERLDKIVHEVINFDSHKLGLIEDEIQHNYNRFYDEKTVRDRIAEEIAKPIIEFLNDR